MPKPPEHEIEVFNRALELPVPEQAAYLAGACAGDVALCLRVEELLRVQEQAGGFLARPGNKVAPRFRRQ